MKIKRLLILISIFAVIVLGVYLALKGLGLDSVDKLQDLVLKSGLWGVLVFILLTWAFMIGNSILPTFTIVIVGVNVFSFWAGIGISIIALVSGTVLLFFLGRKYGTKIVKWVAGKEDIAKWQNALTKGKYTLFLLLLFPASPDDLLYILAGTSNMTFKTYFIIILLTKPIGIIFTGLFGGGKIIPFAVEYIWAWALLFIGAGFCLWYSTKNQDKIDNFIKKITKRA